ncbi:MAG: GntR family transcriptional regulator [Bifidobacterium tibiigranuli]|uniref:GntR family transcriptional regulator n=1 Tax=Bifidobacterium tibiigranuli TaxID=2172043 RepID=UPI0026EE089D|nr:GntR family transcriptional regulator [Bifidobacterium tibiigranuli]MCI1673700.1 GntR family transcriptional regulator [Bifidobacterium tibiigranuli]MCI1712956.1 GntR family transcriptional regulator [Bifidobacterium tibiigranuli]MCI1833537.1 GntR family transcriptional regulator [Bifidobacterium tibiigranuli]
MTDSPGDPLSQSIYLLLRERIIAGELPPGSRLRERELADSLNVSRVPIREAILRLTGDGMVTSLPRRGATVARLALVDVVELFDARVALEVQATRLAARRAAEGADSTALRRAVARAEESVAAGETEEVQNRNPGVHDEIIALANNKLITSLMRPIAGRDRWIFRLLGNRDPITTCHEHRELVDAIVGGDTNLAAALDYAHIERGRHQTLEGLRGVLPDV